MEYPWQLSTRTRIISDELIVAQMLMKRRDFYWTHGFIPVFTRARQWSLPWARSSQYISILSLGLIVLLHFHIYIEIPAVLSPASLPRKPFLINACYALNPSHHPHAEITSLQIYIRTGVSLIRSVTRYTAVPNASLATYPGHALTPSEVINFPSGVAYGDRIIL
jgi:hypothetical protein